LKTETREGTARKLQLDKSLLYLWAVQWHNKIINKYFCLWKLCRNYTPKY